MPGGVCARGNGPAIDATGTGPLAAAAPGAIGVGRVTCDGAFVPADGVAGIGEGTPGDGTIGRGPVAPVVPAGAGTRGTGPVWRCGGVGGGITGTLPVCRGIGITGTLPVCRGVGITGTLPVCRVVGTAGTLPVCRVVGTAGTLPLSRVDVGVTACIDPVARVDGVTACIGPVARVDGVPACNRSRDACLCRWRPRRRHRLHRARSRDARLCRQLTWLRLCLDRRAGGASGAHRRRCRDARRAERRRSLRSIVLDRREERLEVEISVLGIEDVCAGRGLDVAAELGRLLDHRDHLVAGLGRQLARLVDVAAAASDRQRLLAIAHDLFAHPLRHRREDLVRNIGAGPDRLAPDLRQVAEVRPLLDLPQRPPPVRVVGAKLLLKRREPVAQARVAQLHLRQIAKLSLDVVVDVRRRLLLDPEKVLLVHRP